MQNKKIKKLLEISLTKSIFKNELYFIIENNIKPDKIIENVIKINKVGFVNSGLLLNSCNLNLKFYLYVKTFNSINLAKMYLFNKKIYTNIYPCLISIKFLFYTRGSNFDLYTLACSTIVLKTKLLLLNNLLLNNCLKKYFTIK